MPRILLFVRPSMKEACAPSSTKPSSYPSDVSTVSVRLSFGLSVRKLHFRAVAPHSRQWCTNNGRRLGGCGTCGSRTSCRGSAQLSGRLREICRVPCTVSRRLAAVHGLRAPMPLPCPPPRSGKHLARCCRSRLCSPTHVTSAECSRSPRQSIPLSPIWTGYPARQ